MLFAVSAMLFVNGSAPATWVPKISEFAARLGLSESQLGLMIVAFGFGSMVAMLQGQAVMVGDQIDAKDLLVTYAA